MVMKLTNVFNSLLQIQPAAHSETHKGGVKKKGSDCNMLLRDPENEVLRVTHNGLSHRVLQQVVHLRDLQTAVTH